MVRDPVRHSSCAANSLRWVHSVFCFQEEHGSATSKTIWALVARFHYRHGWGPLFKKCVFQENRWWWYARKSCYRDSNSEDLIKRGHVVAWLIKLRSSPPPTAVACSFLSPSYTLTIIPHNNFTAYQMEKRIFLLATVAPIALAQLPSFAPAPGQPMHRGEPGTFEIIPDTLISSQQVYFF